MHSFHTNRRGISKSLHMINRLSALSRSYLHVHLSSLSCDGLRALLQVLWVLMLKTLEGVSRACMPSTYTQELLAICLFFFWKFCLYGSFMACTLPALNYMINLCIWNDVYYIQTKSQFNLLLWGALWLTPIRSFRLKMLFITSWLIANHSLLQCLV